MSGLRAKPEFQLGRHGERVVAELFRARGHYVIPSYDYAGADGDKVPKLQGLCAAFPIPDLDVARGGARRWVEVKTKSECVRYRKANEWRHGIPKRLWQAYQHVERITGAPVEIAILELSTGDILTASLAALGNPVQESNAGHWRGKPEVFWPRARFTWFANIAPRLAEFA